MTNPELVSVATTTSGVTSLLGWNLVQSTIINVTQIVLAGELYAGARTASLVQPLSGYGIWATVRYSHYPSINQ
jgi:hypothetical protein